MEHYVVSVVVGNNAGRNTKSVESNETLRKTLEDNNVDYTRGMTMLDGSPLQPGDLDKTYEDFGIKKSCYLLNVIKTDNA